MTTPRQGAGPGVFLLLRRLRAPLVVLILTYAVAVIGFTIVPGTDPSGRPWRMDFLHAFYFVSFLGTTIGLGEIPYPFSGAQRLWATASIYSTVVAWLYGIGALLATLQDPLFQRLLHENRFRRAVLRQREPFVLVCGYGDAGELVTRELTEGGIGVVVVDKELDRVQKVEVDDLPMNVPALHALAVEPGVLLQAGITQPSCLATLALTGDDATNLAVTLNARLLAPERATVCVAHHHDQQAAMARVGSDHIINPADTFAVRLADVIRRPSLHVLYEALTTQTMTAASPLLRVPCGRWIVCGNGRFGRSVRRQLINAGAQVTVVADPPYAGPGDEGVVAGNLLDATTLRTAGIDAADGIVIATADDTLALAVTMLARELKPGIFTVVRQSEKRNTPLFRAVAPDIATLSGFIVAAEVLRIIRAPQLSYFLRLARHQSEDWAAALLARLRDAAGDQVLESWSVCIDRQQAPAVAARLARNQAVRLGDLMRAPDNRSLLLQAVPLLLQRRDGKVLLPEDGETLAPGDQLLLAGIEQACARLRWTLHDPNVLRTLCDQAAGPARPARPAPTPEDGCTHG